MKQPLLLLLLPLISAFCISVQAAPPTVVTAQAAPATPETPEQYAARTQWLRQARFGMFIHWGVYAVTSGEWKGKYYDSGGEWIERIGNIPIAEYKALGKQFTADKYDPKAWADLAKQAGMKYVVITAKHHDGFAMYDSQVSDWNAVQASAAKRDLIAPLAKAVRADGLKFCLYYSQAQDWTHPGGGNWGDSPRWDPAQNGDYDTYLQQTSLPQVREIIEKFHPAVLWWDTPVSMTPERAKPFSDMIRQLEPNIISNSRLGGGYWGDTDNAEQSVPVHGHTGGKLLEVCMTINDTWGYKLKDQDWKSTHRLIQLLSDISSKGGNLLLNVGPDAEGVIPAPTVERLQGIGRWMKVNGNAIYATDASPFPRPLPWGRVTQRQDAAGNTVLYLHVWNWPTDGNILLPTLQGNVAAGHLLANGAAVKSHSTPDGLVVSLPGRAPDPDVSVVALRFAGPVTVTDQGFNSPGPDGRIEIGAMDAYPNGDLKSTFQTVGSGPDASLTGWTNSGWSVEYDVKTPAAGKWLVSAEFAADAAANLTLNARSVSIPVTVAPTGGPTVWQTEPLGMVDLPAGTSTLTLKGVNKNWTVGPSIRRLRLTPAPNSNP